MAHDGFSEDLWQLYKKCGDRELRDRILLHYIFLVKYIVYRMTPNYMYYVEVDDLMSYGILGLIDAIEKFDINRKVKFETYASLRIKGAIIDQIRKQDWVSRSLRQKVGRVEEAYRVLEEKTGRHVSDEDVAGYLQMDVAEVRKLLSESSLFHVISLDEQITDILQQNTANPDNIPEKQLEENELIQVLGGEIDKLTDKEKMVVHLYYYEELNFKEIARVLEVTESRISQIHSKALIKLKGGLREYMQ